VCVPSASQLNLSGCHLGGYYEYESDWRDADGYDTVGNENRFFADPEGVQAIADALRVNGSLTSINLSSNNLTNYGKDMTGITELAAALTVNGTLTSIDLSRNNLCGVNWRGKGIYTSVGMTAIADALRANASLTEVP
jgi:hypothetical protein